MDHTTPTVAFTITRAYSGPTALQDWEDARNGNLVGENRREIGVAYKDGPFTTGIIIDNGLGPGSTDAIRYMLLTVASGQRHTGIEGTGVVVDGLDVPSTGIDILDDYTVVQWLELTRLGPASEVVLVDAANVLLTHLIIYNMGNHGIDHTGAGVSFTLRNSLIYGGGNDGIAGSAGGGSATIDNCTIYGNLDKGIQEIGGVYDVRNTLSMGNVGVDFGVVTGAQENNMSSDATAQPVANQGKLPGDQFVDHLGAPPNFHLKATADAIDIGSDLSASFCCDIDGALRPTGVGWDIGADEFVPPTNYRSIGTAPDYGTFQPVAEGGGTQVTVTAGAAAVTGVGGAAWKAKNRGRGDLIDIDGVNYTILWVDSDTQLTLTFPYAGTSSPPDKNLPHRPPVYDPRRLGGLHRRARGHALPVLPRRVIEPRRRRACGDRDRV